MATYTELNRVGDWLRGELDGQALRYSRENITVLAGSGSERALTSGMVLGKITKGAATGAAVAGNTGNGTITAAPTVGAAAKVGVYRLVCIEPATDLGKFTVQDPDGILIGVATVGTEFTTHLTFTIADGSTDFASGDSFTITVAAGSGKWVQLALAGTDGSEDAAGVLVLDATAPDGIDVTAAAIVRDAVVVSDKLTWPSGITTNQKNTALAQLAALGIINRAAA